MGAAGVCVLLVCPSSVVMLSIGGVNVRERPAGACNTRGKRMLYIQIYVFFYGDRQVVLAHKDMKVDVSCMYVNRCETENFPPYVYARSYRVLDLDLGCTYEQMIYMCVYIYNICSLSSSYRVLDLDVEGV
jgi:hypothetical protein